MAETAAHLVDHVLPVRQWVLSLSKRLCKQAAIRAREHAIIFNQPAFTPDSCTAASAFEPIFDHHLLQRQLSRLGPSILCALADGNHKGDFVVGR